MLQCIIVLNDFEKLAYWCHALKGGTVKSVISRSGEHYNESIHVSSSLVTISHVLFIRAIREK